MSEKLPSSSLSDDLPRNMDKSTSGNLGAIILVIRFFTLNESLDDVILKATTFYLLNESIHIMRKDDQLQSRDRFIIT